MAEFIAGLKPGFFFAGTFVFIWFLRGLDRKCVQSRRLSDEDFIFQFSWYMGMSEFDFFVVAAKEWNRFSEKLVQEDFNEYVKSSIMPYYVKDLIRKIREEFGEFNPGTLPGAGKHLPLA